MVASCRMSRGAFQSRAVTAALNRGVRQVKMPACPAAAADCRWPCPLLSVSLCTGNADRHPEHTSGFLLMRRHHSRPQSRKIIMIGRGVPCIRVHACEWSEDMDTVSHGQLQAGPFKVKESRSVIHMPQHCMILPPYIIVNMQI